MKTIKIKNLENSHVEENKRESKRIPIKRGNDNARPKRQNSIAKNLNSNSAPDNFLNISPNQSQLRHDPQHHPRPFRILISAQLRQVPPCRHSEPRRQQLHQKPHRRGPQEQPQQRVPGDGAGLQIPLQVPGIEEGDTHQEPRPRKQPQLLP